MSTKQNKTKQKKRMSVVVCFQCLINEIKWKDLAFWFLIRHWHSWKRKKQSIWINFLFLILIWLIRTLSNGTNRHIFSCLFVCFIKTLLHFDFKISKFSFSISFRFSRISSKLKSKSNDFFSSWSSSSQPIADWINLEMCLWTMKREKLWCRKQTSVTTNLKLKFSGGEISINGYIKKINVAGLFGKLICVHQSINQIEFQCQK